MINKKLRLMNEGTGDKRHRNTTTQPKAARLYPGGDALRVTEAREEAETLGEGSRYGVNF